MAWKPTTKFEKDFVSMQPEHNFVLGQLTYEAEKQKMADSSKRRHTELEQLNGEPIPSKADVIQDSLAMMEFIQQISGTKPLGEHASMADWDDVSTVEKEAIAMMRYADKIENEKTNSAYEHRQRVPKSRHKGLKPSQATTSYNPSANLGSSSHKSAKDVSSSFGFGRALKQSWKHNSDVKKSKSALFNN